MQLRPAIVSEIERLEEVIIHAPGPEHARMLPRHVDGAHEDYLLFDDLPWMDGLERDYAPFRRVLQAVARVHDVRDLIVRAFREPSRRAAFALGLGELGREGLAILPALTPEEFVDTLITGAAPDGREVLHPLPNLIFTRDLAFAVGASWLPCSAATLTAAGRSRSPRRREMALMRAALEVLAPPLESFAPDEPSFSIEGGDVVVLSRDIVALGAGERTTARAAEAAARHLLARGAAQVVYVVSLPAMRTCMHLDTIFTLIDHGQCLVYPPFFLASPRAPDLRLPVTRHAGPASSPRSSQAPGLLEALVEDGLPLEPVRCGGDSPLHQKREQWSDGANAFALAPGIICTYERNDYTLRELQAQGYEALTADDFCRNADYILGRPRRVAVLIEGGELSRARGGPRCLTLPVRRCSPSPAPTCSDAAGAPA